MPHIISRIKSKIISVGLHHKDKIKNPPFLYKFAKLIYNRMLISNTDQSSLNVYEKEFVLHGFKSLNIINAPRGDIERIIHSTCLAVYIGDNVIMCRVLGKFIMFVDSTDLGITPHLALRGYWEMWITRLLWRRIKPGWHCIDVGANHGYYSLIMADLVGSAGKVVSIEPHPRLFHLLGKTIAVNGFANTSIFHKAVADKSGEKVELYLPEDSHSINASISFKGKVICEVETVTLDELTKEWPRVDFIKIDVEGAEEAVWRGMQDTILRNKDIIIIMEINCERYSDPRGFLESIQKVFPLRFIDYDAEVRNLPIEECLTEQRTNDWMLFLKR